MPQPDRSALLAELERALTELETVDVAALSADELVTYVAEREKLGRAMDLFSETLRVELRRRGLSDSDPA